MFYCCILFGAVGLVIGVQFPNQRRRINYIGVVLLAYLYTSPTRGDAALVAMHRYLSWRNRCSACTYALQKSSPATLSSVERRFLWRGTD